MELHSAPYEAVLREVYLARVAKNPAYSIRAFANHLELSHSHLSRVLNGRKNLSLRQALKITDRLNFDPTRKQTFLRSITEKTLLQAVSPGRKKTLPSNLLNLEAEEFRFLKDWYHSAILEIVTLESFQPKFSWVAKQLGITPKEVRNATARLQRLHLLEISSKGWKLTHRHFVVTSKSASQAIRSHHSQMIEKALARLQSTNEKNFREQDITGTTIAIDPASLPKIAKKIRAFRHSLMKAAERSPAKELYQLNIQFFPITHTTKNKRTST